MCNTACKTRLHTNMKLQQVVREGEDVVLACMAGGRPAPKIKWRREDGGAIRQEGGETIMLTMYVFFVFVTQLCLCSCVFMCVSYVAPSDRRRVRL